MSMHARVVRPDAKGRVALGGLAKGISSFRVTQDENNRLILEPFIEVPIKEKWLFKNVSALNQVKRGLEQSAKGQVKERGSFAQYADEDIE